MITPDRIHELARRTAQRFVNDEDPAQRLYVFEGRHLLDLADVLQNELLDDVLARLQQGFGTTSAPVTTIRRHFAAQHLPSDDTEGGEI